jgi:hypothetical protein
MSVLGVFILPDSGTNSSPTSAEWTVPDNVYRIRVEAIGCGLAGGGAYAKTDPLFVQPGQKIYYKSIRRAAVFSGGDQNVYDSWVNINSDAPPTSRDSGVLAKGGSFALGGTDTSNTGGKASECIADVAFSGGNEGFSTGNIFSQGGGGGGGAGGPNGAGGNGGDGFTDTVAQVLGAGGGGGANGGGDGQDASQSVLTSGIGGANRFGTGAGAGAFSSTVATAGTNGGGGGGGFFDVDVSVVKGGSGSSEIIWTDSSTGSTAGPGGGGGGSTFLLGGNGADYGGGGGFSADVCGAGLVVITTLTLWQEETEEPNTWTKVPEVASFICKSSSGVSYTVTNSVLSSTGTAYRVEIDGKSSDGSIVALSIPWQNVSVASNAWS